MKLKDLLNLIENIAENKGFSKPFICGGVPRDKYLDKLDNISDLDITNGDKTIHYLAKEFSIELAKILPSASKKMDDGHTSVYTGSLKIDFSSNFKIPNIEKILHYKGIEKPTELEKEIYSRDFTCNSLLLNFDLKTTLDLTELGIDDIENKFIRTCLDPELTFKYNVNRIIRVLYLSSKLDFDVDPKIINWIKNNKQYLNQIKLQYKVKNINKALNHNPDRLVYLLNEMDIWNYIPINEDLQPFYNKKVIYNSVKNAQFFSNFDYGIEDKEGPGLGLYSDMKKNKSLSEFRKKRKNKRKQLIDKIRKNKPQ